MKEEYTQIPNKLFDEYLHLFKDQEQLEAVIDLIRIAYIKGEEECRHCKALYE